MGHNGLQLLKDSFILEKETVEGDRERGALVPPLLSHGGHRHDISEPERTGILDMPTALPPSPPLAIPLHPLPFEPPSLLFSPLPVWIQRLARTSWGHCHCLRVKQSPSEGRERKQRASHGTSQEQGWLPLPSPQKAPLLAERCWCDPSTPFSPSVPFYSPPVTPSSLSYSLTPIPKKKNK